MAATKVVMACMVAALAWMVASTDAAISCGTVTSKIAPCITYVTKQAATIPPGCCSGIAGLNSMAQTTPDRQTACRCLQNAARGFGPSLDPSRAAGLPGACRVNIPYAISLSTNCNTVK